MPLSESDYYSKVYGCWLGKNCGGTLGAPLEKLWGSEDVFDVSWYPELPEGGIPNDDLEIQLVWLQALEDRGLDITARDLADYWLDCIQYNFDEYGLHKTNLRFGLEPPLSGCHNNWFKDCMGCPIRSEIWACISPGMPNFAAQYAYQDAIVDHAGGESVYGEMFNAALQSAAFVESDRDRLLDIGLSFIPPNSLTARCIRAAMRSHARGLNWKDARGEVLNAAPSRVAQYSPVNLGIQTIGWLYGADFGNSICKAVNCGYDTDCTGATLGALLGILLGKDGLPKKWTAPMSDTVSTNVRNGGITNLREPANLHELTERVCRIGAKVSVRHQSQDQTLRPTASTTALWARSPTAVEHRLGAVNVTVDLPRGPAVGPLDTLPVQVTVANRRLTAVRAHVGISLPERWGIALQEGEREIPPCEEFTWNATIRSCEGKLLRPSIRGGIRVRLADQPQVPDVPLIILGSNRWLVTERLDGTLDSATAFEDDLCPHGVGDGWTEASFPGNAVDLERAFERRDGVLYLRHYVRNPDDQTVRVGFPSTTPFKMWLNGHCILDCPEPFRLRPNYGGDGRSYADVFLRPGWNQFVIKVERRGSPAEAHFVIADAGPLNRGLHELVRCRLPWEE